MKTLTTVSKHPIPLTSMLFAMFLAAALLVVGFSSPKAFGHTQEEADQQITINMLTELVRRCKEHQSVEVSIVPTVGDIQQYQIECRILLERTVPVRVDDEEVMQ